MTTPTPTLDRFNYALIPDDTIETLNAYKATGRETGGFLRAVLANDLKGAVERADGRHLAILPVIVVWLYNNMPLGAQGSYERYTDWVRDGGLKGLEAK